jgi:hypothetical protein
MSGDRTFGHTEIQRGRPKTSRLVAVTFKLEPELLRRVDEEAARRSIGRSDALRALLTRALDGAAAPAVDGATTSESLSQIVHRAVLDWLIDLSVVQAPGQLDPSARALGIARPGRGLVFYVMPR